ncbi:MAG: bacteriohemerythrin [Desulfuromonadaceae bacterium]|nr:bacteriohemerythrin [Desulfuromonadaceae bacterium]
MSVIEWQPAFSVLVSRFDEQHKGLINLINDLHSAMQRGEGQVILGNIFNSLVDYTKNHFADEERLMEANGYPDISRQKNSHDLLLKRVVELQGEFVKGNSVLSVTVLNFLRDWLTNHIQGEDKMYGRFFNDRGIF